MTGRRSFHRAHCLGCGPDNPATLGLTFSVEDERVRGSTTLDERHEGAPGFAHGGAVATALDDTLGTLLISLRRPAVTARLEVDYRRPALLGRQFELEAWTDRIEHRKLHLAAVMRDDATVVAEARALFLQVEPEHFLTGGADMPEAWTRTWRRDPPLPY